MALSDALGIQALVQSYDEKAVNQALASLATKINKSVDDVNKDLNKIKIDKDVMDKIVNQLKALPEEVHKKTQGISFDLFSDLINADGAEEKIDEAMKTFSNKIQSFVKLRDQIGNDELIIKADYSQIDELIGKTERLLELQKELDKWQSGKSRTKKSINADISSVESEIKSGISNLNVSGGQVGVGVNVDNEALAELDKKIKETEESLKSAREEAEKYGGSLDVLKKKIDQTYNKSIDKDTQKNADNFREAVQNYIKAGGSQKDLDKDYLSWYKLSGESWPKNFIPLNQIANESEEAQQKVQELENALDNLYRQREALSKGVGSNVISSEIDAEKLKEQEQEINKIKESLTKTESQLEQVNQKYAEQSNLVSELENKLKALEGINNPKVIETDEYKNIISELEAAKKKASEFQNEMNELRQTVEVLKSSLSSYNTGDVVPRQDLENANRVIDNLSNKINELETSLTETKNKFALLSEEVTKLQQDKSDLSGQLAQQKEINAAQQEQISNQSKIQAELEKTKNKLNELLTTIAKLQDIQKNAISTIENYGEIEEFKKASKIVGYNEGIDTPENFVNFDYLEKAKQKVQELGKEYDKLDVKASVYYNQYLQKGGTEKIFDANGKDVSNELISLYTEMSSLINQTGDISIETSQKILRSVNSQIYSLNEEKKALQNKNKELEKAVKLEEKATKEKKENQKVQQEQTKTPTAKRSSISQEQFRKDMERERAKAQSNIDNTTGKGTLQVDFSSIVSEQQALEKLEQAIKSVTIAIAEKNKAIQAEEVQMDKSVNSEISKLEELKGKLNEIKSEFENGIASGLFKNTDDNDTTIPGEVTLSPKLSETFKSDADKLLDGVKIEKEVELKIGELNGNSQAIEDAKEQIKAVDKNANLSVSYNPNQFNELLSKDFSTKNKKEATSQLRETYNVFKQYYNDLGALNTVEGQKAAYNYFKSYEEAIKQNISKTNLDRYTVANGIYENEYLNYEIDLTTRSMKLFSEVQNELGNIKINDSIAEYVSKLVYNLREFEKVKSDLDNNVPRLESVDEVDGTYSMEATKKEYEDISDTVTYFETILKSEISYAKEFGETLTQSVQKAESAIAEVNDELNKSQRQQIKPVEGQAGNQDQDEKKSGVIQVPVEPLINQSKWEEEIDRILGLIGTKKIKIEPDTTSQEWNDFKAYIEKISNLTINLKNVSERNASPQSDLNNSYKRSINAATELHSVEEKIAKAKESNNRQELEKLSTLEAQKKKFEELLKLEENFRANERFSGIDTSANDSELNQLRESFNQEYQKNRQTYASDLASNMDNLYDEAAGQYSKKLLQDQLNLQKEIESTKTRIVQLEKDSVMSDEDELSQNKAEQESLKQKLSLLEQSSSQIQNEINQFDQYIDKQKQAVSLEEVRSKAEKDRAKLTKNSVDDSNNYARVNNLLKEQEETIRQINILQTKQDNTGLTDTEQSLLNSLSEKYLSIQERVTEELNKQYEVTSRIADRREKLATNNIGLDNIRSLDFSGDINFGNSETQINRITTAIDEANTEMQKLKSQGQTDLFANEFDKAAIKVQNLNNELLSNNITLSEYKSSIKELQSDLSKKTNAVEFFDPGNMEATMQQMKDIALQIPGIQEDTLKWGNANKTLTATLQDQNDEWKKVTISAQNAGNVITKTFTNVNAPAGTFSKFLDQLSSKFMNLGSYLVSFVGFYEVWDAIKQGVTYVKDLDTALTEMRKVSDETVDSLREFQEASFGVADSIGTTAKEIQNSTADFMRLGYSLQEAGELAQDANIYANVGDMEIDEATEHMISSIKAWGSEFESEVDASEAIIDRYNEIGM